MGSVLKFIKGLGQSFMSLPTSTKLKIASGAVFLLGGVAIAASASSDDISEQLLEGGQETALPETNDDEVIEVEPEVIGTETD